MDVDRRQALKYAGIAVGGLILLVVLGFLLGFLGVPWVEDVENRFGPVNDSTTVIETDLIVHNPNPVAIRLGGSNVNYTVYMNEVTMAHGNHQGLGIGTGNSTVQFTTFMQNEGIPEWWYTHVDNGEVTEVLIDADVSLGFLFGGTMDVEESQQIETDILSGFNSTETQPINADVPLVSDPVLYLNATRGWYGEEITRAETPIETAFDVYNPKPWPYTVNELGYEIRMNGVPVGSGATQDPYTLEPETEQTLRAETVLDNDKLDEWWVSHLQNDQVTELTIDLYLIVDPDPDDLLGGSVEPFRVDTDQFDYTTTIETDIFGTKNETDGDGSGPATASETEPATTASGPTEQPTTEPTTTEPPTTTDEGVLPTEPPTTEPQTTESTPTTSSETTSPPPTTSSETTSPPPTTTGDDVLPVG